MNPFVSNKLSELKMLTVWALLGLLVAACAPLPEGPGDQTVDAGVEAGVDAGAAPGFDASGADGADDDRACPTNLYAAAGQPCDHPGQACNADGTGQLCPGCPDVECTVIMCDGGSWQLYDVGPCDWDAGQHDSCPPGDTPPEALPSEQTVTFVIENDTTETYYAVVFGWFCDGFGVTTAAGVALPLSVGFECICECPNPGAPRGDTFVAIEPGAGWAFTWDARSLRTYTEVIDCNDYGWDSSCQEITQGVRQPVEAGTYRVRVPFELELDEGCWQQSDGTFSCSDGYPFEGGDYNDLPTNPQQVCPGAGLAEVEFELPASGDTEVHISLSGV